MKKFLLVILVLKALSTHAQEFAFPMKGSYIYYKFDEDTKNSKNCIRHYFLALDKTKGSNGVAMELLQNVSNKVSKNLAVKTNYNFVEVFFFPPIYSGVEYSCEGDVTTGGQLGMALPTDGQSLLSSVFNTKKFKVESQTVSAKVKIQTNSPNKYSLIFSNFQIEYRGVKNTLTTQDLITEVVSLEDVYSAVKENAESDKRMYTRSTETFKEIDRIVNSIAKIYSEELKKTYELDEL